MATTIMVTEPTENMAAMGMENTVNMAHTATMVALGTTVTVSMGTRMIIL